MTVRQALKGVRWYVREVSGESAYERYLAHHTKHHPGERAMTEPEFWRWRMDDRDRRPTARCC